ncbi:MAG: hypothetical protein H8E03_00525 [Pelagibacteraceae bacterium]|nr:hypothetical protein [Pelagibacteraceae bacterium]
MKPTSKLFNEVLNFKAEMEATGSVVGVTDLMKRIKKSEIPMENKVGMVKSLKRSFDITVGKPIERDLSGYELSRSPYGRK